MLIVHINMMGIMIDLRMKRVRFDLYMLNTCYFYVVSDHSRLVALAQKSSYLVTSVWYSYQLWIGLDKQNF